MSTTVDNSIDFRDAINAFKKDGKVAYVRLKGAEGTVYRVIPPVDAFSGIELVDLFENHYPPVTMETVASAMARAAQRDQKVPVVEILTLGEL